MGFIDCDGHVVEHDATWDYLDPGDREYRPRTMQFREAEVEGVAPPMVWVMGNTWSRRLAGDSNLFGNANLFDPRALQLTDPTIRVAELDVLGIDVQLLISSFFIGVELDNPLVEAALMRSYNRWMADRLTGLTDRLAWTACIPVRVPERVESELRFAKEHGAVGVHVRGIHHGNYLSDRMFWHLYERAQDLDMAIVVHLGASILRSEQFSVGRVIPAPAALSANHLAACLAGFHAVLASDYETRFPRLRFAFVEGGAGWAPTVIHQHARMMASALDFLDIRYASPDELEAKNVYITCEADEDLAYLTRILGEHVMVIGTDYGHNDIGSELGAHDVVVGRSDIGYDVARAIVDDNGRRLLGIKPSFRPAPEHAGPPLELPYTRGARTPDGRAVMRPPRPTMIGDVVTR